MQHIRGDYNKIINYIEKIPKEELTISLIIQVR